MLSDKRKGAPIEAGIDQTGLGVSACGARQGGLDCPPFLTAAQADADLAEQQVGDKPDDRGNDDDDCPGKAGCRFAVRAKDRADKNRDLRNGQQPHGDHVKGLHDA